MRIIQKRRIVSGNLPESRSNPWGASFHGILPNQKRRRRGKIARFIAMQQVKSRWLKMVIRNAPYPTTLCSTPRNKTSAVHVGSKVIGEIDCCPMQACENGAPAQYRIVQCRKAFAGCNVADVTLISMFGGVCRVLLVVQTFHRSPG